MPQTSPHKSCIVTSEDADVLYSLSLKKYRFLSCRHLSMLHSLSEDACQKRMAELCEAGLVTRVFAPTTDGSERHIIYTLKPAGAHVLAKLKGIEAKGLASAGKSSYLFLEHALRISDFMCSLEVALRFNGGRIALWRSERQLKWAGGRGLKVPHPFQLGQTIPVIPDGLVSIEADEKIHHFCLEADRSTMSLGSMQRKLLGYFQLFRRRLHESCFGVPHFRVLLVTDKPYRRDNLRAMLRQLSFCPNMFYFGTWSDMTPQRILGRVWLKCREETSFSLLDRQPDVSS